MEASHVVKIEIFDDGRATIERYVLAQQPEKFIQQPDILTRLRAVGVSVLPVTVANV